MYNVILNSFCFSVENQIEKRFSKVFEEISIYSWIYFCATISFGNSCNSVFILLFSTFEPLCNFRFNRSSYISQSSNRFIILSVCLVKSSVALFYDVIRILAMLLSYIRNVMLIESSFLLNHHKQEIIKQCNCYNLQQM